MVGFFPPLCDGELIDGALAHYGRFIGAMCREDVLLQAFGSRRGRHSFEHPGPLARLVDRMPPGNGLSAEAIFERNTCLPYEVVFASPARARALRHWAVTGEGRRLSRLGILSSSVARSDLYNFCCECVSADRVAGAVPKLWRQHQLPGVSVCAKHGTPLACGGKRSELFLIPPAGGSPTAIIAGQPLLKLARWSEWAVSQPPVGRDLDALQGQLTSLLGRYRWIKAPSLFRTPDLARDVLAHPGARRILSAIGKLPEAEALTRALNRLLRVSSSAKHPALVFVLLELVGADVGDLTPSPGVPSRPTPAHKGSGVLQGPCANPVCKAQAEVPPGFSGKVTCPLCGFAYRRLSASRFPFAVLRTGPLWDAALARLMSDSTVSVRQAACRLGVSPSTVVRHARRIGAERTGWSFGRKYWLHSTATRLKLRDRHRKSWLGFRSRHGKRISKEFPPAIRNAYRWLCRHEPEWLAANMALVRVGRPILDWTQRDADLAAKAHCTIARLRAAAKLPRIGVILAEIGLGSAAYRQRHNLPSLWATLEAAQASNDGP